MSDIQTMQDMLLGLKAKKKTLQGDEKVFLKVSGINEEIEKAIQDKETFDDELTGAKERRDLAKAKKAGAVAKTTSIIAEKMNAVLPFGTAVFSYDEDNEGKRSMEIGWADKKTDPFGVPYNDDLITTPYNGLSGGEKQIFEAALANVLNADIIVVEAAELDGDNLQETLQELSKLDKQVLLSTCHPIEMGIPENFELIEV